MTQRPSTSAWVERVPSFARRSSEMCPPEAGPWAKAREIEVVLGRRSVLRRFDESMVLSCVYDGRYYQFF